MLLYAIITDCVNVASSIQIIPEIDVLLTVPSYLTGLLVRTAYFCGFFLATGYGFSRRSLTRSIRAIWPWLGVLTNSVTQLPLPYCVMKGAISNLYRNSRKHCTILHPTFDEDLSSDRCQAPWGLPPRAANSAVGAFSTSFLWVLAEHAWQAAQCSKGWKRQYSAHASMYRYMCVVWTGRAEVY